MPTPVVHKQHRHMGMSFSAFYIPKDTVQKPQAQGEDAHFIHEEKNTIGVADGVGSWAKYGVDAGEYARQLMRNALIAIHNQRPPNGVVKLREALEEAFQKTMALGSSTACIVTFKDYYLHSINVGDSGFMIFRKNKCVYKSLIYQHGFNQPYQLQWGISIQYRPEVDKVEVLPGDIIVLCTDGLLDNMFPAEIEDIIEKGTLEGVNTQQLASSIATMAFFNSIEENVDSPFADAARLAGQEHIGGKRDDVTVIVGHVVA